MLAVESMRILSCTQNRHRVPSTLQEGTQNDMIAFVGDSTSLSKSSRRYLSTALHHKGGNAFLALGSVWWILRTLGLTLPQTGTLGV